ncbi:hypothetical protein CDD81_5220 [Ophiocordyceps australis]|uniref:Amine oxidase n=1 Tax=Ophiocordyceps australis TaxID=1399860 RepID=A0A2C5XM94_9HYPO|nr:hypothetical protein CDD81_5220 [Ophiocordyceps australis]
MRALPLCLIASSYALLALGSLSGEAHVGESPPWPLHSEQKIATTCSQPPQPEFHAPRENIWYGLSDGEVATVTAWLLNQQELNLTANKYATSWDNIIDFMQLLLPNKTESLSYIDGNGPKPPRYAQVSLSLRASENATLSEIMVGPLPVGKDTRWEYLVYPYSTERRGSIRNLDVDDRMLYVNWLAVIGERISDITMALWNKTATGAVDDTLLIYGIEPSEQTGDRIIRWDTFWARPTTHSDSISLLPQGLYIKSDVTGRDPSKWKLEGFLYNEIFYATEDEFRRAFYSKDFVKLPGNVDGSWTSTDQHGPSPPLDHLPPPVQVAPAGTRYSVDHEANYVRWLDWTFYIRVDHSTGVAMHDVRHKDERILYELAMQEALAHYTGNDPITSGIAFLDSYNSFAKDSRSLIPGYDCPLGATYLNISYFENDLVVKNANAICLFEADADYPLSRHTADGYVTATKNIKFVLRWIATVNNYDYLFSYEFFLDGSMEIKVRASGYIFSAFATNSSNYGYRIHNQLSGAPHDHVLNFKADFDILGQQNSLQLAEFVPVTKSYVWSKSPRNTFHIERSFVESEDQGRMKWNERGATQYSVVNTDRPNRFGEYRGYRIAASGPSAHLSTPTSSNLQEAVHPFTFDLAVTRRKDEEPKSAHPYNGLDVAKPMVNFDKFFNGESLRQQDLVLWFNLGMHHLPSSGDLPNTLFNVAHTSIQILPVNYHETDPSRETIHRVRIDLEAATGAVKHVERFGQDNATCKVAVGGELESLYAYGQR